MLGLGQVAAFRSDFARAAGHYEASRERFAALGEGWGLAWALVSLGRTRQALSALDEARSLYEEALAVARRGADDGGSPTPCTSWPRSGLRPASWPWLARGPRRAWPWSTAWGTATARRGRWETLGRIAVQEGKLPQARALGEEDLALRRDEGSGPGGGGGAGALRAGGAGDGRARRGPGEHDEALRRLSPAGPLAPGAGGAA